MIVKRSIVCVPVVVVVCVVPFPARLYLEPGREPRGKCPRGTGLRLTILRQWHNDVTTVRGIIGVDDYRGVFVDDVDNNRCRFRSFQEVD
jgi:hypothetical protein